MTRWYCWRNCRKYTRLKQNIYRWCDSLGQRLVLLSTTISWTYLSFENRIAAVLICHTNWLITNELRRWEYINKININNTLITRSNIRVPLDFELSRAPLIISLDNLKKNGLECNILVIIATLLSNTCYKHSQYLPNTCMCSYLWYFPLCIQLIKSRLV